MKKLIAFILIAISVILPASAEFVPIVQDDVIYILDSETGNTPAMITDGMRYGLADNQEYLDWFLDFQLPAWLKGTWIIDGASYISFNDDDIVANGESFKRNAMYNIMNDGFPTLYKAGSVITDDVFLLQTDGYDRMYLSKTANPNLVVITYEYPPAGDGELMFRAGHPYGSSFSFPTWMQGIWESEDDVEVIITESDFIVDDESFAAGTLDLSLMWIDGVPVYFEIFSVRESESGFDILYNGEPFIHVEQADDPNSLLISSDYLDGTLILKRAPILSL